MTKKKLTVRELYKGMMMGSFDTVTPTAGGAILTKKYRTMQVETEISNDGIVQTPKVSMTALFYLFLLVGLVAYILPGIALILYVLINKERRKDGINREALRIYHTVLE